MRYFEEGLVRDCLNELVERRGADSHEHALVSFRHPISRRDKSRASGVGCRKGKY